MKLIAHKFIVYGYSYQRFLRSIEKKPEIKPPSLSIYHSMMNSLALKIFRTL